MLRTSVLFLLSVGLLPVAGLAQPPAGKQIMSGLTTLPSGVTIRFWTVATPASADWSGLGQGGISADANAMHRIMIDKRNGAHSYFGYDLVIGNVDGANGYLATFQPLSGRDTGGANLTRAADPKFPPPQPVHDGDVMELDLMVSADGKQKITDYIEFLAHEPEPAAPAATGEPRDFAVDDGPVAFQAQKFTVWIDGQKVSGMSGFTGKPGATFWIALPGQGRYVLSLVPHDGFIKSGAVRDNALSFQDGGRTYEVRFMGPIAGAGKAWNLYLLHDTSYIPNPNLRIATGTDRLENLLPKH